MQQLPYEMFPFLIRPNARIKDGGKRKSNWAKRYSKMIDGFNRCVGITHSHAQENARRRKQIEKGMIKVSEVKRSCHL